MHLELTTPVMQVDIVREQPCFPDKLRSLHWRHISLYYPSNNYTEQSPLCLPCLLRLRDYCIQRSTSFVLLQRLTVALREEVMFSDSLFHLTFYLQSELAERSFVFVSTGTRAATLTSNLSDDCCLCQYTACFQSLCRMAFHLNNS